MPKANQISNICSALNSMRPYSSALAFASNIAYIAFILLKSRDSPGQYLVLDGMIAYSSILLQVSMNKYSDITIMLSTIQSSPVRYRILDSFKRYSLL
jgi:hypothetical protein